MTHRRYEGPGLNEPDFHVVVQGTSHTPACSVLPPMLPSLALPSFFGSTYGSQEILSEVEIAEVSSSPPSVVTLDSASSPPSSSPLQVFSSSPLASSQASEPHDDPEPEKFFFSPSKVGSPRSRGTSTHSWLRYNRKAFRRKHIASHATTPRNVLRTPPIISTPGRLLPMRRVFLARS